MDIHKPKPWHGLREFVKEYLIIVVGVLTALAGEQAVEWLHWRHLANEGERHLASGLQDDLAFAADWLMVEPCLRTRLRSLADELAQPGPVWKANRQPVPADARPTTPLPMVIGGMSQVYSHVAWETALGSDVLNHMPQARVETYAEVYRLVDFMRERGPALNVAQTRLAPLGYDRKLSESDRTAFISQIGEIAGLQQGMFNSAGRILSDARGIGLEPPRGRVERDFVRARHFWGACVRDVSLSLPR